VTAEVALVAETLDIADLSNALNVVRHTSVHYCELLGAYFGAADNSGNELR